MNRGGFVLKLYNFDKLVQNDRVYGGLSGRKIGVTINKHNYILKFPGNLKERNLKNIDISYSNSPLSEFLGSQIYKMVGIPVHETFLGYRNNKIVVACRDFLNNGDILQEFGDLKVTMEPTFVDSLGNETNGTGTDLQEVLLTIRNHPLLKDLSVELESRFWEMFIVDAYIGNADRNNGNWGIIKSLDGNKKIAPVYDNGNSFNNKWSDEKIRQILLSEKSMVAESYNARRCIFEHEGKRINPYHYLLKTNDHNCQQAIKRIVPKIEESMNDIKKMLNAIPYEIMSDNRQKFFEKVLQMRLDCVLRPAMDRVKKIEYDRFYEMDR